MVDRANERVSGGGSARQASAALPHEKLLDAIVEGTNDLIFLKDARGRFVLVNRRFAAALGRTPEEVVGKDDFQLVSRDIAEQFVAVDREVMDSRKPRVFEHSVAYDRTPRTYLTNKMPWRNEEGEVVGVIGISHDITDRKSVAARLQRVRDEERRSLARDVHDDLGSVLTAMRLELWDCIESLPEGEGPLRDTYGSLVDLVDLALRRVQDISWRLRSPLLDDFGLIEAIRADVADFAERVCPCVFHCELDDFPRDFELETTAYRILQESLTNVSRHAEASHVEVSLGIDEGCVTLDVEDDGVGIEDDARSSASSLGLLGMRERAAALSGQLTIAGRPGQGTSVRMRIPLRGAPAA